MAETHDTIKGLLAEFRGYAAGMPPSYHVTMSWADFRKMLDRFEAANKRECEIADAKIADLQSRVKLWTDRSAELVKKCDEHYANAHKRERGDTMARMRISELYDALKWYKDSKAKGEE